jgi:hypothetical protein
MWFSVQLQLMDLQRQDVSGYQNLFVGARTFAYAAPEAGESEKLMTLSQNVTLSEKLKKGLESIFNKFVLEKKQAAQVSDIDIVEASVSADAQYNEPFRSKSTVQSSVASNIADKENNRIQEAMSLNDNSSFGAPRPVPAAAAPRPVSSSTADSFEEFGIAPGRGGGKRGRRYSRRVKKNIAINKE